MVAHADPLYQAYSIYKLYISQLKFSRGPNASSEKTKMWASRGGAPCSPLVMEVLKADWLCHLKGTLPIPPQSRPHLPPF